MGIPCGSQGGRTLKKSGMPRQELLLLGAVLLGLAVGLVARLYDLPAVSRGALATATGVALIVTSVTAVRRILRAELGVDVIAILAMAGALALGQYLAGAIIAVMLSGGAALEAYAVVRAQRELSELVSRAPQVAHRKQNGEFIDVPASDIRVGERVVVKSGEVVPVDGILTEGRAVLDESSLTGETRPVSLEPGAPVRSGVTNTADAFEMRVTAAAAESTYASIVRLVDRATQAKAPFVRLADRYAAGFLAVTLGLAALTWLLSGEAIRALAVLVVATPCPLILAAPAAIIAGVSRAARRGIIMKGGGALEILARAKILLLDKTGTVTDARPAVVAVERFAGFSAEEVIRSAASLEQLSIHPYGPAILEAARSRRLELAFPTQVTEKMGTGISGTVNGRRIAVGQLEFVAPGTERTAQLRAIEVRTSVEGSASTFVSIGGMLAGALLLQDPIRPAAPRALRELRAAGIRRIHLVTGDHPDVAELVGDLLGVDQVFAESTPEEKVEVVRLVRKDGITAMVGDGINDAPALALADVGIAMGARGATAASEAADIVLTSDRFEGIVSAVRIAQRTRRIALESVMSGMALSLAAMALAAAGYIAPIMGALLQEGIDVLVIFNALRALTSGVREIGKRRGLMPLAEGLAKAHRTLRPRVGELAQLAEHLDSLPAEEARSRLLQLRVMLEKELLPHEAEEQQKAYPVLEQMLKEENPTGPLIHTHYEIRRLTRLLGRLIDHLPVQGPVAEDLHDLRRVLYGLHAVLTLHFSQEDELYSLFAG